MGTVSRLWNTLPFSVAVAGLAVAVASVLAGPQEPGSASTGVPYAPLAASWFAVAALLQFFAVTTDGPRRSQLHIYCFGWAVLALGAVVHLARTQRNLGSTAGLFVYGCVAALFVLSALAPTPTARDIAAAVVSDAKRMITDRKRLWSTLLVVVLIPSWLAFAHSLDAAKRRSSLERWFSAQHRADIPSGGSAVSIVVFEDYQCPFSQQLSAELASVIRELQMGQPDRVRLFHKSFPLSSNCNAYAESDIHPAACEAAVAAKIAARLGRGEAMDEWLSHNKNNLSRDTIRDAVRTVAQIADFDAEYNEGLREVRGDVSLGHALGVAGTPTVFVNGVRMPSDALVERIRIAATFELQRQQRQTRTTRKAL